MKFKEKLEEIENKYDNVLTKAVGFAFMGSFAEQISQVAHQIDNPEIYRKANELVTLIEDWSDKFGDTEIEDE
jgi:hypothetical protein